MRVPLLKYTIIPRLYLIVTLILITLILLVLVTAPPVKSVNNFVNVFQFYSTDTSRSYLDSYLERGVWRGDYAENIPDGNVIGKFGDDNEGEKIAEAREKMKGVKLLIMILSGVEPEHKERRKCVRSSYVSIPEWKKHYSYFFLVGESESTAVEEELSHEAHVHGDIVRYPVPDSYKILSSKVMWGFQYVLTNRSFNLLLKTDDDSFINIPNVLRNLSDVDLSAPFYAGGRRFPGRKRAEVKKRERYKDLYREDFEVPEHFCAGGGYFMSRPLVEMVLQIHKEPPPAQVEDMYVGSLIESLGVPATSLNVQTNHGWQNYWNKYYNQSLVLHYLNCKKMMRLYNQLKLY